MLCGMPLYRLCKPLRVLKVANPMRATSGGFEFTDIAVGEIVEAISGPNEEGRLLIKHRGCCYRAWKEELRDKHIAQRLVF